jgi:hypothetical protein
VGYCGDIELSVDSVCVVLSTGSGTSVAGCDGWVELPDVPSPVDKSCCVFGVDVV